IKELKARLAEMFEPENGWCYQRVLVLPAADEIDVVQDKVTLVIADPHVQGLNPDLKRFYEQLSFRNRVGFLTGQRNFDALLKSARELKAINQIIAEMIAEGTPDQDPQLVQGRELADRITGQFLSATRETFTTLYYPTDDGLMSADFLMEFRGNHYHGEDQITKALAAKQKYTEDISSDVFRQKAETRLFTQQSMLWTEIKRRAASNPKWQWHKTDALDKLKEALVHQDFWRESGGYVDRGPFPQPATAVRVQVLSRDDNTGRCKLRLTAANADTLYAEVGGKATTASQQISGSEYTTEALEVSFLAVDSTGVHETGEPLLWRNTITLKSRLYQSGSDKMLELRAAPSALVRYSTDGSDPRNYGASYEAPFVVPSGTRLVLAAAEKGGVSSDVLRLDVDWTRPAEERPIDLASPATWRPADGITYTETRTSYALAKRLQKHEAQAGDVHIVVGKDKWVDLNFESSIRLNGDRLQEAIEFLRGFVGEGEVTVEAKYLAFSSGQRLMDYVEEIRATLSRDDVQP
ncbi:MAG: FN3 associated domain-containing protein, partial [Burkholderiales bacterium]